MNLQKMLRFVVLCGVGGVALGLGAGWLIGAFGGSFVRGLLGMEIYGAGFGMLDPEHQRFAEINAGTTMGAINGLLLGIGVGLVLVFIDSWTTVQLAKTGQEREL